MGAMFRLCLERTLPVFLSVLVLRGLCLAQADPPVARKQPVADDYRWLEDWQNPETRAWSDSENAYARRYLKGLPGRDRLREQIGNIISKPAPSFDHLRTCGGSQ